MRFFEVEDSMVVFNLVSESVEVDCVSVLGFVF